MPEATLSFAFRPMDNGGRIFLTDNRQAELAMGRMDSYTVGPDCIAARHTDARSLAMTVPSGTLVPTAVSRPRRGSETAPLLDRRTIARLRLRNV
jgi:hypothetical protein